MALMLVMNVQPPDKSVFEDVALETGIAEPFVEKDWFVTQVISILSKIKSDDYEIIFSGGTSLSKAHGLLQRFSEDIDFRVLTDNTGRKSLSVYKNNVIERLRQSGFHIEEHQIKARDGNKYFSIKLAYETQFERSNSLRPHVQIELTARDIQLPAIYLPVRSFVSKLSRQEPEVLNIGCIDPVESAADKLSAFVSPTHNWQSTDYPSVTSVLYVTQDKGEEIFSTLDFSFTTSHTMAQRIAKIALEQVRRQRQIQYPANLAGFQVAAGNTIAVDLPRLLTKQCKNKEIEP